VWAGKSAVLLFNLHPHYALLNLWWHAFWNIEKTWGHHSILCLSIVLTCIQYIMWPSILISLLHLSVNHMHQKGLELLLLVSVFPFLFSFQSTDYKVCSVLNSLFYLLSLCGTVVSVMIVWHITVCYGFALSNGFFGRLYWMILSWESALKKGILSLFLWETSSLKMLAYSFSRITVVYIGASILGLFLDSLFTLVTIDNSVTTIDWRKQFAFYLLTIYGAAGPYNFNVHGLIFP
jgi:hypothetical protein